MTWFDNTLVALWVLNVIVQPVTLGKTRKPRTNADAIAGTVVSLALIVGLLATRGVL